eukprot:TRINITY_DN31621_c0_g1_i1.p1 TRINITY_DN31621_c0_g1~~TRINITY_DN31621_c0_g1_i1.p1  ORF type:complete len:168 (-),score=41.49 TRINITY_DN31621_c0_g1_i1:28-531(-)
MSEQNSNAPFRERTTNRAPLFHRLDIHLKQAVAEQGDRAASTESLQTLVQTLATSTEFRQLLVQFVEIFQAMARTYSPHEVTSVSRGSDDGADRAERMIQLMGSGGHPLLSQAALYSHGSLQSGLSDLIPPGSDEVSTSDTVSNLGYQSDTSSMVSEPNNHTGPFSG